MLESMQTVATREQEEGKTHLQKVQKSFAGSVGYNHQHQTRISKVV
jgi:hypothetical protein